MEPLDAEAIDEAIARGLSWERQGDLIVKVRSERDFKAALELVNRVAELAEAANHHPDIEIRWNTVTFRLTTHDAGGLTRRDLELARQIDQLSMPD